MDRGSDNFKKIVEAVLAFDSDPTVYNLKGMLVTTQFGRLMGNPLESLEYDVKTKQLVPVLKADYAERTNLISEMLFIHATQYYPTLFASGDD